MITIVMSRNMPAGTFEMLDDFFVRALFAGSALAIVAGPLGCFVVWRRMAYFGDTMAHSGLLGVALAFLFEVPLIIGVFAVAVGVSMALLALQRKDALPSDSLLGILSHSALALGLVLVTYMTWLRIDLLSFLFGDILAVSKADIAVIVLGGATVLAVLAAIWRPLIAGTVSSEIAQAEGLSPERAKVIFMILMACVIAMAMKLVGVILITALLIIPAASARQFSSTPEQMAGISVLAGILSVATGLFTSLQFDTPSGPSIVVASLALYLLSLAAMGFAGSMRGEPSEDRS